MGSNPTGVTICLGIICLKGFGPMVDGETKVQIPGWIRILIACVLIFLIVYTLLNLTDSPPTTQVGSVKEVVAKTPDPPLPNIGSKYEIKNTFLACSDDKLLLKLIDLALQNDDQAYKAAMYRGLVSQECLMLPVGNFVYVTDVSVWKGLVKIRPVGNPDEYWTFKNSIKTE